MAKIYKVTIHSEEDGWAIWYYNSLAEAKKWKAHRDQWEDVTITRPIEACEKPTTQREWMKFLSRLTITV
tara:strand:+ start:230 stop:439 length:210 start_codon:yes stop_codon:yes gene_type:complete